MYNNTSKIMLYTTAGAQVTGVILPHSNNVCNLEAITRKIEETTKHIMHLTHQLPHRSSHGGKRSRERIVSIKDQILLASQKLDLLIKAKVILNKAVDQDKIPKQACDEIYQTKKEYNPSKSTTTLKESKATANTPKLDLQQTGQASGQTMLDTSAKTFVVASRFFPLRRVPNDLVWDPNQTTGESGYTLIKPIYTA